MVISFNALKILSNSISDIPPETGGILGSANNCGVVTHVIVDTVNELNESPCKYRPNTNYLNLCIDKWYKNNIQFVGLFHTHFFNTSLLSNADILYIKRIMQSLPPELDSLYFPLFLLPSKTLIGYEAIRQGGTIDIISDPVTVTKSYY